MKDLLYEEWKKSRNKENVWIPWKIIIDITGRCNYDCKYCLYRHKPSFPGIDFPDITTMDLKVRECGKITSAMEKLGISRLRLSGGGEPLYHPRISSILKNINKIGFKWDIVTNGILIDKHYNEIRKANHVDFTIWASNPKDYARLHGTVEDNYNKVLSSLNRLSNDGVFTILCYTILPDNYNQIYDTVRISIENGCKALYIRKAMTTLKNDILTFEQELAVKEQIDRIKNDYPDFMIRDAPHLLAPGLYDYNKLIEVKYCRYLFREIVISCDGNLYPCAQLRYYPDASFGNIRTDSLGNILKNRKNFIHNFVCKNSFCTLYPEIGETMEDKELKELL